MDNKLRQIEEEIRGSENIHKIIREQTFITYGMWQKLYKKNRRLICCQCNSQLTVRLFSEYMPGILDSVWPASVSSKPVAEG